MPLCPPSHHPSSDPIIIASLSSAPWHRSAPRGPGKQADQEGYLFVAIDRTSKFAFTELHVKATTRTAADFLRALVKAVPCKIHTVLTDNGIHFTDPKGETWTPVKIRQMIARKEPF